MGQARSTLIKKSAICILLVACVMGNASRAWPEEKKLLTPLEEQLLLKLSRETLALYLHKQQISDLKAYALTPPLQKLCGVFVTLKEIKNNELRGCIGFIEGVKPLAEAVIECTVYAATRDSRFPPMQKGEDTAVSIEISVLSSPRRITSINDIKVGEHGLILSRGIKKGVLLPQVPLEQHWNREEFLKAICKKADLPERAWDQGAELSVFSAQVFGENHKP